MTAQEKLTSKVSNLSASALKDIVNRLNSVDTDEACIIVSAALDALMAKVSDIEFVAFCEAL